MVAIPDSEKPFATEPPRMGKPVMVYAFLLAAFLLPSPVSAQAQIADTLATATIHGQVTDAQSHEPIGQVEIAVIRKGVRAYTGDDGHYLLEHVPAGACTLGVAHMGYTPLRRALTVTAGAAISIDL